eukprot:TRINITY_DN48292_c0_g1_i1.p1 TRINITY_DN48292_c0_g1~~TRINITY_DN48292_c0_g1_i1.p1  ORF type:complete len:163 (+),score=46.38 TRINITY_DN48292_c0_g1_i1:1-489(+)
MNLRQLSLLFLLHLHQVFAPVPRCSPLFIINKVPESMSLTSDMNPYFPVAECEYGGPIQAILAGDFNSVFILDQPEKIPLHNLYELTWIVKKGWPRLQRILAGEEEFKFSPEILLEGYKGDQKTPRLEHLGQSTSRDKTKIDESFSASIQELLALEKRRRRK